jgi:beta-ribofuranosylaminobenzene 5'-phosphate synthase
MIRIRTQSRLHFGLFSLPNDRANAWLNYEGQPALPRRHFGGVGLMIDKPGIELTVALAESWSGEGPLAQRALYFAQTYCKAVGIKEMFRLHVDCAAPEHAGLGTGTQLGLAVACAIAELTEQPTRDAGTLARCVGRGQRSAIGVHGFELGGFLVEGGKTSDAAVSPLLLRYDFPDDWHILLITPRDWHGTHGCREIEAFGDLMIQERDDRTTETLCRLVLLGMLPALIERDLPAFGEAIYDFNRRVGEMFQSAQGGIYAHPRIEEIVKILRGAGVKGVGQSSWGPTVFAVGAPQPMMELRDWLIDKKEIPRDEIDITSAGSRGV